MQCIEKFKETNFYKIWVSPFINVLFATIGNAAGIWMSYFIIEFIFFGLWEDLKWPGFKSFEKDGVFLLLSFAFLTSIIYSSSRRSRINGFFIISLILLIIISFFYARFIAVEQIGYQGNGNMFENWSIYLFCGSIVFYYIVLVYESFLIYSNPKTNRQSELERLKQQRNAR